MLQMASNCRFANCKMTKRKIGAVCGTALLIAAAVVVALREQQSVPLPDVPPASPAEVRVKAVERNPAAACMVVAAGATIGAVAVGSVPAVVGGLARSSLPASRMLPALW